MIKLELTYNEASLLHRIFHSYLAEVQAEISTTQIEGLSELLKEEAALMQKTLDYLEVHGIGISAEAFGGYPE